MEKKHSDKQINDQEYILIKLNNWVDKFDIFKKMESCVKKNCKNYKWAIRGKGTFLYTLYTISDMIKCSFYTVLF